MNKEEKAREEGNGKGDGAVALSEGGKVQGEEEEPVDEEAGTKMDEEVDQVKAENLQPSHVIVHRKRKIGKESNRVTVTFDQLVEPFQGEVLKMNAQIFDDVGGVIKLKGDVEGVGIGQEGQNSHEAEGEKMLEEKGAQGGNGWCTGRDGV
jgi:hypothetical protein